MKTELTITGAKNASGEIEGSGKLVFIVPEFSKSSLEIKKTTRTTKLSLVSKTGIKLRKDKTLTLTGALSKELKKKTIEGKVGVELKFPKNSSISVEHEFRESGGKTSLKVTIHF